MLTGQELYLFERAGYFVRHGVLAGAALQACREAAQRVVEKGRAGLYAEVRWSDEARDDFWGVNHILHPTVREPALLEALANPQVQSVIEDMFGEHARYHLATLLCSPARKPYHIAWHRDIGPNPDAPPAEQAAHLARYAAHVQFNGALVEDESLWVVPGTHLSPLLPEQREALRQNPRGDVPGQVCVRLEPGDFVFYNANLLHKGRNEEGRPRLTLHCAFVSLLLPELKRIPQPWLSDPSFLESLPERLRPLFERFVPARG
jgi:ectoine hydroxylase-related dioxygenase (phytanoyl-CoA dioxygenase family)